VNRDEIRRDDGCANAAPYVLGALTEEEHEAFLAHLATCAVCREEVAALQAVAAALPAAAPQFSAPPELKRRVMSEVAQDARRATGEREAREPARRRPGGRARLVPALAAGFAAVLAVVVVIAGGGGGSRVVQAHVSAPGASASVRLSGGHAFLTVNGMPQAPPGRVYELWVKRAGSPEPTDALFTVTSRGDATVGVPGGVSGVRALLVTAEPRGGSSVPSRAPVIVANL
jgi:anti-sigma-K factor RskA